MNKILNNQVKSIENYKGLLEYIVSNKYSKINIIGIPASGKSTLANLLTRDLGFQKIDLDDYLYQSNCKRKSHKEDINEIERLLKIDKIIIDGTYTSTLANRIQKIDLFILTNGNYLESFFRFFKRLLTKEQLKCGEKVTMKTMRLIYKYKQIESLKIVPIIPQSKLIRYNKYD